MVRQYKIHTDLDGAGNRTFDMTNGLIRFYEPNDLGLSVNTNVWQSRGIGVMGDSSVVHNPFEFKFETFGADLHENYYIFNEFINAILKQKYVTLEYTNELGTFYADIQLSQITKTEGYGFNGTFSEKISFIPVTAWYVYEQLKFSKVENGEVTDNSKVYGAENFTLDYPNLNLLEGTNTENTQVTIPVKINYHTIKILSSDELNKVNGQETTASVYIDATNSYSDLALNYYSKEEGAIQGNYIKAGSKGWSTVTRTLKNTVNANIAIIMTQKATSVNNLSYSSSKIEQGSVATPWMPHESEVSASDYPNLNLSPNTKKLIDEDNNIIWGITASGTTKTEYTEFLVDDNQAVSSGMKITMDGTKSGGQAGWRSPTGSNNGSVEVKNSQVTLSAYVKNDSSVEIPIGLQIGMNANQTNQAEGAKFQSQYTKIPANSGIVKLTATFDIPAEYTYIWFYCYGNKNPDALPTVENPYIWSFAGYKAEWGKKATPWMPAESDIPDSKYGYKYDYTYFGEDDIERFSKWEIDDGIFSFTARMTPSRGLPSGKNDYGVRFLDEQFNEYTAIVFGSNTKPDSIQFNTDVNDEYYLANIGISTINVFSALNYQRFRTRFIQKGTMELVNVDVIEMNIKRKVEFA
ncbi:phage distal tail protein domain-containing protein [Lactococcus garvieae]|uniref:phage distal tail protein domain-containing protein n=1 Tax=Lactococcus garvieae TaxID=1363 RepID=UPI0023EA84A0|nr:phage distal tail protein domain-containing protein [Lactococcus garvieae]